MEGWRQVMGLWCREGFRECRRGAAPGQGGCPQSLLTKKAKGSDRMYSWKVWDESHGLDEVLGHTLTES